MASSCFLDCETADYCFKLVMYAREQTAGGGELTAAHLCFESFGSSAGMFAENIRRTTYGRRTIECAQHLISIENNSTTMRFLRAADFN